MDKYYQSQLAGASQRRLLLLFLLTLNPEEDIIVKNKNKLAVIYWILILPQKGFLYQYNL